MPSPMAKQPWQLKQEDNLRYVGQTRAEEHLIYLAALDDKK
jgi:ATP-dependent exoDNAse (exonuclease V) beta subunit